VKVGRARYETPEKDQIIRGGKKEDPRIRTCDKIKMFHES